jgi:hypothetical protein
MVGRFISDIGKLKEDNDMSKYTPLWEHIQKDGRTSFKLTYAEIEEIAGIPIDHSFLTFKKELDTYGYQVGKISIKEQTVTFNRLKGGTV